MEFLKTAEKVERNPWNLTCAAQFLRDLIKRNEEAPNPDNLPTIDVFTNYHRSYVPLPCILFKEWHDFAPGTPKLVSFHPVSAGAKRRRITKKTKLAGPASVLVPPGQVLGCSKCRHSPNGCKQCRTRAAAAAASAQAAAPEVLAASDLATLRAAQSEEAGAGDMPALAAPDTPLAISDSDSNVMLADLVPVQPAHKW